MLTIRNKNHAVEFVCKLVVDYVFVKQLCLRDYYDWRRSAVPRGGAIFRILLTNPYLHSTGRAQVLTPCSQAPRRRAAAARRL